MRQMHSDPKKQAFTKAMYDGHLWDHDSFLAGYEAAEERLLELQEVEEIKQTTPAGSAAAVPAQRLAEMRTYTDCSHPTCGCEEGQCKADEANERIDREQDTYVGGLQYAGNTVSFMYSKAKAYRRALEECFDVLREFGIRIDYTTHLKDYIRKLASKSLGLSIGATPPATSDALLQAGQLLSNWAFNRAQNEGHALTADDCNSLKDMQQQWDKAARDARAAPPSQQVEAAQAPSELSDARLLSAVKLAYGHLWHINPEAAAPVPLYSPEQATGEARIALMGAMTVEDRRQAIQSVGELIGRYPPAVGVAAPAAGEGAAS